MAATKLFVNINAGSVGAGLVRGLSDNTPVALPQLVIGDNRTFELYFVDGSGNYAPWSGNAAYIPSLAIGGCGYPAGGTFTLKFGANTTSALAFNASMATIQAALQGLASIGANNCLVAGSPGQYFTVTFVGALAAAPQSNLIADFSGLTPASNINVFTLVTGSAAPATNAVQLISFAQNPITYANNWTTITNGWTGQLTTNTVAALAALAAGNGLTLSEVFQVSVTDPASLVSTYVQQAVTILCTLVNPSAYAGTQAPVLVTSAQLAAAVLGQNNFTQEAIASSAAGNSNVTRGATSRHHVALATITGPAGTRTFSLLTSSSPNAGDTILLALFTPATAGIVLEVHNATAGGTLLSTITTTADAEPFFQIFEFNGTAWVLVFNDASLLDQAGNLAGIASPIAARLNLLNLFSSLSNQTANFAIGTGQDGVYFKISTAAGNVLATLPSAATVGDGFLLYLQKVEGSPYVVTTSPATVSLSQSGQGILIRSNGSSWDVVLVYSPSSAGVTVSGAIQNLFGLTGLTGGGSLNLDGLATANGAQPAYTIVCLSYGSPRASQLWQLVPGTDAAASGIIRPTDFDASLNPQVWKQIG